MGMVTVLPGLGDRVDGVSHWVMEHLESLGKGLGLGIGESHSVSLIPILADILDLCSSQTQERMERHLTLPVVVLRGTVGGDTQVCRSEGHRRCHDAAWVFHVPWGIHPCALGSGLNTGNHGITKAGKAL